MSYVKSYPSPACLRTPIKRYMGSKLGRHIADVFSRFLLVQISIFSSSRVFKARLRVPFSGRLTRRVLFLSVLFYFEEPKEQTVSVRGYGLNSEVLIPSAHPVPPPSCAECLRGRKQGREGEENPAKKQICFARIILWATWRTLPRWLH